MDHDLHKCNDDTCSICLGGLSWCTICNGAEASMPTDCPGTKMNSDTEDAVQNGDIDFKEGQWVALRKGSFLP